MKTYVQSLRIEPYLTILDVVPFRVAKASVEIMLHGLYRRVFPCTELCLNLVEGDRFLDDGVVVGVLSFRRKAKEFGREQASPVRYQLQIQEVRDGNGLGHALFIHRILHRLPQLQALLLYHRPLLLTDSLSRPVQHLHVRLLVRRRFPSSFRPGRVRVYNNR